MWMVRLSGLGLMVAATAACSDSSPAVSPPASSAPAPPASSAPVDSGYPACAAAHKIDAHRDRVKVDDIIDAADLGANSPNEKFAREARVVGDFTLAAETALQAGDPADQVRPKISGYLDELIDACHQYGYLAD
jgi:hypothetical protein